MYTIYKGDRPNKLKPNALEIARLNTIILKNRFDFENIEDFAELLGQGFTVLLSSARNKIQEIEKQDFVMLDFDNKEEQYSIKDLEKDTFIQKNACFYYRTFSDENSKVDKFRVVFRVEKTLTTQTEVKEMYKYLFKKYPQSDTTIGQASRMFFGGNSGYKEINFNNVLKQTKTVLNQIAKVENQEIISAETPVYKLLQYKQYDLIREKFGTRYKKTFIDEYTAMNYFKNIPIDEFLDLPRESPFLDIFHEEENPSASIYFAEDYSIYLYKCFSESTPFTGDIITVVSKILNLSKSESIDVLIKITNSNIDLDSDMSKIKKNANIFKKELMSGSLEKEHKELYQFLKNYSDEVSATLEFMFDYMYLDDDGNPQYLNYFNIQTLAKLVSKSTKKKIGINRMKTILNVIVVTEVIQKVSKNMLPRDLYKNLIEPQENNPDKVRTSNVYQPKNLDDDYLKYMNVISEVLVNNNVNYTSLSYELVYRLFGEEKAMRDFPQAYKPLEEKGLIKMSKQDKNLTRKQIELERTISKVLNKEISEKGYMIEQNLIKEVARIKKTKQSIIKYDYSKIKPELLMKYDLKRTKMTKKLHKDLKVTEDYSQKMIIYR